MPTGSRPIVDEMTDDIEEVGGGRKDNSEASQAFNLYIPPLTCFIYGDIVAPLEMPKSVISVRGLSVNF